MSYIGPDKARCEKEAERLNENRTGNYKGYEVEPFPVQGHDNWWAVWEYHLQGDEWVRVGALYPKDWEKMP